MYASLFSRSVSAAHSRTHFVSEFLYLSRTRPRSRLLFLSPRRPNLPRLPSLSLALARSLVLSPIGALALEDITDGFKMRVGHNLGEGRPAHTGMTRFAFAPLCVCLCPCVCPCLPVSLCVCACARVLSPYSWPDSRVPVRCVLPCQTCVCSQEGPTEDGRRPRSCLSRQGCGMLQARSCAYARIRTACTHPCLS